MLSQVARTFTRRAVGRSAGFQKTVLNQSRFFSAAKASDEFDFDWKNPATVDQAIKILELPAPDITLKDNSITTRLLKEEAESPEAHEALKEALVEGELLPAFRDSDPESPLITRAKAELAKGNKAEAFGISEEAGLFGDGGILAKWGVVPVVGLALATIISKEFYVLDEEFLTACCFGSFVFTAYVTQGEAVGKALDAEIAEIRGEQEKFYDAQIRFLEKSIALHKSNLNSVEQVTKLVDIYNKSVDKLVKTRGAVVKKEVTDSVLQSLDEILRTEQTLFSGFVEKVAESSRSFVEKEFSKDQKLRSDYLSSALQALSGMGKDKSVKDPLAPVYQKWVTNMGAELKRMRSTEVTLTDEQYASTKAEIQAKVDAMLAPIDLSGLEEEYGAAVVASGKADMDRLASKFPHKQTSYEVSRKVKFMY